MEKQKVYVLCVSNYGTLANDYGATEIIGVYKARKLAEAKLNEIIEEDTKELNFVVDTQDVSIVFFDHQENWDCYYEIFIREMEVQ